MTLLKVEIVTSKWDIKLEWLESPGGRMSVFCLPCGFLDVLGDVQVGMGCSSNIYNIPTRLLATPGCFSKGGKQNHCKNGSFFGEHR